MPSGVEVAPAPSPASLPTTRLGGRFFAALGIGLATTSTGAALLVWAFNYEITSECLGTFGPCTPGPLQAINGVLFLVGILLTFIGLGFAFAVLASGSERWRDG
jgi:hypothetical protein